LDVERIQFNDGMVALDTAGNAGQVYRLYRAAFDRTPDLGGLGFWLKAADGGMGMVEIANFFIKSPEFIKLYGQNLSHSAFLDAVYQNVLHRAPDPGGKAWYLQVLNSGAASQAAVLADVSESLENQGAVAELIAQGIDYTPYLG
jgi:hypothetical protein